MALGIGLSVLLFGLAVAIATRPAAYRVQRSESIGAPAEVVFRYLNDFHLWPQWSPYENLDPNLSRTYEGASSGVGAVYGWSGNGKAGQGRMTIRESAAPERIVIDLRFDRPFKSSSVATFDIQLATDGVAVTWSMSGQNTLMGKAFSLVVDMDKLLGSDFERGLKNLKALAEGRAELPSASRAEPATT
jgi:uncharacterized protein YndB with AHSA1/START domain